MSDALPERGFIFWPVGCGDSTTIAVNGETIIQIDLNHLECADDDADHRVPVIDRLVELLPKRNNKPYLAAFMLTHPDRDHCCGFKELLKRVTIGELWHTPRIFREYHKEFSEDAQSFRAEAARRAKAMVDTNGAAASGDRVRLIGWDDLFHEDKYKGFPPAKLSIPGNSVTELDGVDHVGVFRAFIHAPFKDDSAGERNETSLAMQVRLEHDGAVGRAMLLGDLSYPTLKRLFDASMADDLAWNILLAPHHCSKSAMYWQDEGEAGPTLKQDILDQMEAAMEDGAVIVGSCVTVPASNEPGDNPPHAVAKARYEELTSFECTGDRGPEAIVFTLTKGGLERHELAVEPAEASALAAAVTTARGAAQPPAERVGFGRGA